MSGFFVGCWSLRVAVHLCVCVCVCVCVRACVCVCGHETGMCQKRLQKRPATPAKETY